MFQSLSAQMALEKRFRTTRIGDTLADDLHIIGPGQMDVLRTTWTLKYELFLGAGLE